MREGRALKLERVAAGVKARDLAKRMGVPGSRVSVIEGSERVTAEATRRYREALAACIAAEGLAEG